MTTNVHTARASQVQRRKDLDHVNEAIQEAHRILDIYRIASAYQFERAFTASSCGKQSATTSNSAKFC